MSSSDRTAQLRKIRDDVWNLKCSPLYLYRKKNNYYPVIGEGNHFAKIMFIGEAPGRNEAETGKPFCGTAGAVLDKLLAAININRKDVYVTNILKDRPPGNRDPSSEEIKLYAPFLLRQIEIIQPRIIATLGRFSMRFILEHFGLELQISYISRIHGKIFRSQAPFGKIVIVPLFHPAVAVYDEQKLPILKWDFQALKDIS